MPRKKLQLKAQKGCRICGGRGQFTENHGDGMREVVDCECIFRYAPDDDESQDAIDAGDYEIISARREDEEDWGRIF